MLILLLCLFLHSSIAEHSVEITYPRNGTPILGPQVKVGLKLMLGTSYSAQLIRICIGTLHHSTESNNTLSQALELLSDPTQRLTSDSCFEVEVETNDTPLESELTLEFETEGWHFLRLTLEIDKAVVSTYSIQTFVTLQNNLDSWNCELLDQQSDSSSCVWLDRSMYTNTWGVDWPLEDGVGWGTIARNIVSQTQTMGIKTLPLRTVDGMHLSEEDGLNLKHNMRLSALLRRNHMEAGHSTKLLFASPLFKNICGVKVPFPVFHSLGRYGAENVLSTSSIHEYKQLHQPVQGCSELSFLSGDGIYWGSFNVAIMFSENSTFTLNDLAILKLFDVVLGGSTWNVNMLRRVGLPASRVALFRQGINPELFKGGEEHDLIGFKYREYVNAKPDNKFYVFSGGKFEFRKGQDIVVAAFRKVLQIIPNAVLLVAWANAWPQTVKSMEQSTHTSGYPRPRPPLPHEPLVMGALNITDWLSSHGIPPTNVIDLGVVGHDKMANAMRMADVALFPNRCEGGTNLVAMEAAALGLPLVLSSVTGHIDLVQFLGAVPVSALDVNSETAYIGLFKHTEHHISQSMLGWGESDVDEIVESLKFFYHKNRGADVAVAARIGAMQMRDSWSWMDAVKGLSRVVV